jgi:hypothetical protein
MTHHKFSALLIAIAVTAHAAPAAAQATRTWVSGVGDDVNPCSRTAPCKTFAGAISKTAAGGEINCLDPGGYGAVTITKSMTISCPYTEGGTLAAGNGIVVNAGASDVVHLRGLDIFGVNPPGNGVRFIAGAALHIADSTIRRFNSANSFGVSFQPTGASRLYVTNTTIADNGQASSGGGILVQPTGNGSAEAVVIDSLVIENKGAGISAAGERANVLVGSTTIMGNGTGLLVAGGAKVHSYGDNRLNGNSTDGAFTATAAKK